jgi:Trk-type K+ transport system membrane component
MDDTKNKIFEIDKASIVLSLSFFILFVITIIILLFRLPFNEIPDNDYFIYDNYYEEYILYNKGLLNIENMNSEIKTDVLISYFEQVKGNNSIYKIKDNKIKKILLVISMYFLSISIAIAIIFHDHIKIAIKRFKNYLKENLDE